MIGFFYFLFDAILCQDGVLVMTAAYVRACNFYQAYIHELSRLRGSVRARTPNIASAISHQPCSWYLNAGGDSMLVWCISWMPAFLMLIACCPSWVGSPHRSESRRPGVFCTVCLSVLKNSQKNSARPCDNLAPNCRNSAYLIDVCHQLLN